MAQLRGRDRHRHRAHLPQRRRRPRRREYIAGYTIGNDFGLHDFRDTDAGSMLRVKGSDTLAPGRPRPGDRLGLPRQEPAHATSTARCVQEGSTDEMEWDMHYLVADIARTITLQPGRPAASPAPRPTRRPVEPGDVVEVEVEGLGPAHQPRRRRARPPIRTDVGAQPTESEEVVSTALGGDWEFRGIRTPSKDLYPSLVDKSPEDGSLVDGDRPPPKR